MHVTGNFPYMDGLGMYLAWRVFCLGDARSRIQGHQPVDSDSHLATEVRQKTEPTGICTTGLP